MAVFPDADLPTVVDFRFDGLNWVDLSARLLDYPIDISAGRSPGSQRAQPSSCGFTLDNNDGALTPLNPMSVYWPNVKLGIEARVRNRWFRDTFTRSQTDTWGSDWSNSGGAASDYDVNGSAGTHTQTSTGARRMSIATPVYATADAVATVSIAAVATGASATEWVTLGSDTSNFYAARLTFTTSGGVNLQLIKWVGGSETVIATATGVGTYTGGTHWSARIRRLAGGYLLAKAWQGDLGAEPTAWTLAPATEDTSLASFTKVMLISRRETGNTNTNLVASWYDVEVNDYRAEGFADSWQPDFIPTTEGTCTSIVRITASGISRRLTQGAKPLRSAMFRTMAGVAPNDYKPHAYWPMEDGPDSRQFASAVPGVPPLPAPSGTTFASNDDLAGSDPLPTIPAGSVLPFVIPPYVNAGQFVAQWLMAVPAEPVAEQTLAEFYANSGPIRLWRFTVAPGSPSTVWIYAFDAVGAAVNSPIGVPLDGSDSDNPSEASFYAHMVMFTFAPQDSGGNVHSWFGVCSGPPGEGVAGANSDTGSLGLVTGGKLFGGPSGVSIGHLGVYVDPGFSIGFSGDSSNNIDAMFGYAGETADARAARLCREQGVAMTIIGSSTAQMGPQGTAALMDLLGECEDVDQGVLGDLGLGLGFTCGSARYNLPATVTIDLSTYRTTDGSQKRVLSPTYDDQGLETEVTADRPDGSFAIVAASTTKTDLTYEGSVPANVYDDQQLTQVAAARASRRSQDVMRFPGTPVDLGATTSLIPAWQSATSLPSVARMVRTGLPDGHFYSDIDELLDGYTETLGRRSWTATYQGSPAAPYDVAVYGAATPASRYGASSSTLASGISSSATSLSVATASGPLWVTGAVSFDIEIGGERMTVSNISGASSPQTFTIAARSVNGVVKSHSATAPVNLFRRALYAL